MKRTASKVVSALLEADVDPQEFLSSFASQGFQSLDWELSEGSVTTDDAEGKEVKYKTQTWKCEFGSPDDQSYGAVRLSYAEGHPMEEHPEYSRGNVQVSIYRKGLRTQRRERRDRERRRAESPGIFPLLSAPFDDRTLFNAQWSVGVDLSEIEDYKRFFEGLIKKILLPIMNERKADGTPAMFPVTDEVRNRFMGAIDTYFQNQ
ncbi:MAG: hypothetical protein ACYSUV_02085 [Planctomycetota bacterium]|jgi:hypothetical protein